LIFLVSRLKPWMSFDFLDRYEVHSVAVWVMCLEMFVAIWARTLQYAEVVPQPRTLPKGQIK